MAAGKEHLSPPQPGTAGVDFGTPGRTRGQARLLGSARGAGLGGTGGGIRRPGTPGRGLPGRSGALVMRPPASTDARAGARVGRGRALSPTASVMKATWMKSDSQLSTYMNHMAPAPRPSRDRRDGPARSGSGDTEPPHRRRVPAPRAAVRRRREEPGPSAASGRVRTSAACRRGGPTAAAPGGALAGRPPGSRGCTQGKVGDASWGKQHGPEGRGRSACAGALKAASGLSCALPPQPGGGSRAGEGRLTPPPQPPSRQKPLQSCTGLSLATSGNTDKIVECLMCARHCAKRVGGLFMMEIDPLMEITLWMGKLRLRKGT